MSPAARSPGCRSAGHFVEADDCRIRIRIRSDAEREALPAALDDVDWHAVDSPAVEPSAVRGLKSAEILPLELAGRTMSQRLVDREGAVAAAADPHVWVT